MVRTCLPSVLALLALCTIVPSTAAQMITFRHPLGYRFDHPSGWQVQQTEKGIVIFPGDAGGTEVFGYSLFMHDGMPYLEIQAPGHKPRYYRPVH